MTDEFTIDNSELETLFRKYESAPDSYVFAPLADAYRKAGMLDEAIEICRKGIRKHAQYASGRVVMGKCYFDMGELDEAESSFQAVLDLDENNLVALKYLGVIQVGRGDMDVARDHFKHILELDPDNREIRRMLEDLQDVEASAKDVDDETADDEFEGEPITLGRDDAESSDELATTTLADIYAAQGYGEKAAKIYREILRRQPNNEEIRRKLLDIGGDGEFSEIVETGRVASGAETGDDYDIDAGGLRGELLETTVSDSDEGSEDDSDERAEDDSDTRDEPRFEPLPGADEPAEEVANTARIAGDSTSRTLDEQKSYEQFKRWLDNIRNE